MNELLPDDEFYAQLNTVNLASGALIRDPANQVLIVNPTYRDHWLIPGGSVDKDEAPSETCRRELKEELDLDLPIGQVLAFEYLPRRDFKPEAIHFIFDGGVLTEKQIENIKLNPEEHSELLFCSIETACDLLDPSLSKRFKAAWDTIGSPETCYLERGSQFHSEL